MTSHRIENYEKGQYLIQCAQCAIHWRKAKQFIKLKKSKINHLYVAWDLHNQLATDSCPNCQFTTDIISSVSRWKLWKKEKLVFRPYQTVIECELGKIATIRFHLVKTIKAQGTSAPYLVTTQTHPIIVHGEFSTATLWKLQLSTFCTDEEGKYKVNPFSILVTCADVILYRLNAVTVKGNNTLVSIDKSTDSCILTPTADFSAFLSYLDPIWTKA